MNILFIGKRECNGSSGIEKKMEGQIKAFEKMGHNVYYTYFESGIVYVKNSKGEIDKITQYRNNIFSMYLANERAIKLIVKNKPGFFNLFYMRKGMCSSFHIRNLKLMRKQGITIIEEIPTFPYDQELKKMPGIGLKIYYLFDVSSRMFLKKYVKYFVIYNDNKEIFGIPTIQIENGIDISKIPVRIEPKEEQTIRILTVSAMYFWHGYDRLIKGLADYYHSTLNPPVKVILEMVGDGFCKDEWKQLSIKLGIGEFVNFHGMLSGKNLDDVFNRCHLAVASLGIFRKGIYTTSELKIREYTARGIPFIVSSVDCGLPDDSFFYKKINDNEENVNIDEILEFYQSVSKNNNCTNDMRKYAEENFSWCKQLEKVIKKV